MPWACVATALEATARDAVVMHATTVPMRVRASDTLDVVLPLEEEGACVCPGPRVDDGDARLVALAYAPRVAVLTRVRFTRDGVLDAGVLAGRLAGLATPRNLIRTLAPALAVAEMDREHGGLLIAAFDSDGCGGLVDTRGLGALPPRALEALTRGLVRVIDGCVQPARVAPRWTRAPKRLVLMRGAVLDIRIDLVAGTAALGRSGETPAAELTLLDTLGPGHTPPESARFRFTVPSGENAICIDVDALFAFLRAPSVRALLVEGRTGFATTAAWHEALARPIDAVAVGAVVRPAPAIATPNQARREA